MHEGTGIYRGIRDKDTSWIYGNLIENQGNHYIYPASSETTLQTNSGDEIIVMGYYVYDETIGLFTGQPDKNGTKIFEGDIVKAFLHNETPMIFPITFRAGCFWFGNWSWCEFLDKFRNAEVIGNIIDNPELLEGGEDND